MSVPSAKEEWLWAAVIEGNLDHVGYALDTGADIEMKTVDGWTALNLACYRGENAQVVQLLIDRGADIKTKDSRGWTPLMSAAYRHEGLMIEILQKEMKRLATAAEAKDIKKVMRKRPKKKRKIARI